MAKKSRSKSKESTSPDDRRIGLAITAGFLIDLVGALLWINKADAGLSGFAAWWPLALAVILSLTILLFALFWDFSD